MQVNESPYNVARILRRVLPNSMWRPLRALSTAVLTPIRFARVTGHWRSSLASVSKSRSGDPIPWYTYPAVDFLAQRDFTGRRVLEFGAGQSTLWWARRAERVIAVEENKEWYESLQPRLPANVELIHEPADLVSRTVQPIRARLDAQVAQKFDVIVVDGHLRRELTALAFDYVAPDGAIIFDNAEGYGFHDETKSRNCRRIDFFGFAPGVSKRHCTSLVFIGDCFLLDPRLPVADIENVSGGPS